MIEFTKQLAEEHGIPNDRFEFQMLYGMRSQTQLSLVEEGYRMRVYLPYGDDWYGYFMRRLAERRSFGMPCSSASCFVNSIILSSCVATAV